MIPSALGGGETFFPIRALVLGPDFNKVAELSKDAAARIRKIPGLLDVDTSVSLNSPELQVKIDRQRASDLGVRAADVGNAVRLMIAGEDQISTYKEGDEQYDVTLQLLPEQQKNPEVLARLMIPSSQGRPGAARQRRRPSSAAWGPARIERYNRQFQVQIFAQQRARLPARTPRPARWATRSARSGCPPGYSFTFTGSVKILDETTRNLIIAFLLASIFMYMVLAAQFDSFLHPFTIMLSLPLSIPFALFSLWITGRTLNLWSSLGVLLLLGIVKKNGILQVDYTNKLREEGMPLREAILQANHVRLRPILMTTLAIVAGLIPTALGIGAGSAQRSAVAVTIIGGQMLCLLPTLLITPVAYSLLAEAEIRGIRFGPSWLGAPLGDRASGRLAAPVGAGPAPRSRPRRQSETPSTGVDPRAAGVEPRVFHADADELDHDGRAHEGHEAGLPAEAREQDRVERLERLLDVRVAVRFRPVGEAASARVREHALGGLDEGEANAAREMQGAEARRVVAEAGRLPEVVLSGGLRIGVRARDVRARDDGVRIGADLDADVSQPIASGRAIESEERKAAVEAGDRVVIAVLRGVGEADLERPGLLRLANGRAGRRLLCRHAGPDGQHQTQDDGGHRTGIDPS